MGSASEPDAKLLKSIQVALDLQQLGEHDHALALLLQVQTEAPDYAPLHLLIGLAYRETGRLEEAEARLRRAIELDPAQAEAIQSLGLLLLTQKRPSEAIDLLKRHVKLVPDDPVTLKTLAAELTHMDRADEAVQALEETWHASHSPEAGITCGRLLIRLGRLNEAEALLSQVAEETLQPRTLVEWAYALVLTGEHQKALQVLLRIVDLDRNFDRAWRGLTECYIPLGRYSEALMAAEQALAINDRHCRNWFAKANALLALQRHDEALEAARNGIECVPRDDAESRPVLYELMLQTIESLFQLGRTDEALAQLNRARREFPSEERFVQIQVAALNSLDRSAEALQVLDEAVAAGLLIAGGLAPRRFETLHLLGRPDDAYAFIQPMLTRLQARRLEVLAQIGLSFYEQGRARVAQAVFEQLAQLAPEEAGLVSNLGFILIGEGQLAEAGRCFQQALELPGGVEVRALILANLGYLHLIQGEYAAAGQCLREASALAGDDEWAILRIAYWCVGEVMLDCCPQPSRSVLVRTAAAANLVTLALAQGQIEAAEELARKMNEEFPDSPWGHAMQGWVLRTKADPDGARQAWQQALEHTENRQDREALTQWLKALPN